MAFFNPFNFVTLCQFYSTTFPVSFSKLHQETLEWEGKRFFAYMATLAYHVTSTEVENHISKHNWIFRHLCNINNPHQPSSGILICLCKYCIVISDTLVDTFWDVLFLLLTVILSELHEKSKKKDWVTEKST